MATKYLYRNKLYDTEAEAQTKLSEMKVRLDSNPTDWCEVKCLEELEDGAFTVLPGTLTDQQILNPDSSKKYSFWSTWTGETFFLLTSTELSEKVIEHRRIYVEQESLAVIKSIEDDGHEIIFPTSDTPIPETDIKIQVTDITPNEDMSGYI
jgi:hypothetical protein